MNLRTMLRHLVLINYNRLQTAAYLTNSTNKVSLIVLSFSISTCLVTPLVTPTAHNPVFNWRVNKIFTAKYAPCYRAWFIYAWALKNSLAFTLLAHEL